MLDFPKHHPSHPLLNLDAPEPSAEDLAEQQAESARLKALIESLPFSVTSIQGQGR